MKVELMAHTQLSEKYFNTFKDVSESATTDGQVVSLGAIRQCYSYKTTKEVLETEYEKYFGEKGKEGKRLFDFIVKSKHVSTFEHMHFSFAVEGVSRALLAQLTRHRHLSFSVQSLRYTKKFNEELNALKEKEKRYSNKEKRHGLCKRTIGEELKLVDLYLEGFSTRDISKMTGITHTTINGILNAHNVDMRTGNESVVEHSYFEKIDNHRKAQILGFLFADGTINRYEKEDYVAYQIGSELKGDDGYYLEEILKDLSSRNKVSSTKRGTSSICIVSKKMYEDLTKLGMHANKSKTIDMSKIFENVDKKYWNSFLLGYFEGDGHINKCETNSKVWSIASDSLQMLKDIQKVLSDVIETESIYIDERKDGSYNLRIHKSDLINEVLDFIYKDIELEKTLRRKLISACETYGKAKENLVKYVKEKSQEYQFIIPEKFLNNAQAMFLLLDNMEKYKETYMQLILSGLPQEDARSVLPLATNTNLVTSGNLRAWLEFYNKRKKGNGAQAEIAEFAEHIKDAIVSVEPWTKEYFEL